MYTVGIWKCPGHFIREASSPLVPVYVMGVSGRKREMGFGETACSLSRVFVSSQPLGLMSEPPGEECCADVEEAVLMRALCGIWGHLMLILCTESGEEGLSFHQGWIWG